mmetsp:Transcript_105533/g.169825  ORF Transcript_105533/g.169825 Transcript_105533/m.169825 type:complete len:269 (-) Transcript_105533:673-1479(-)
MLRPEIHPPLNLVIFKLMPISNGLLQDTNRLRVAAPPKRLRCDRAHALDAAGIIHFGEELQVVKALLNHTLAAKAHIILSTLHAVIQISKRNLWLNHPKLRQMPGGVRVFGTEGGAKGVDRRQSACVDFTLQLTRYCEVHHLPEEVLGIVNLAVFGARKAADVGGSSIRLFHQLLGRHQLVERWLECCCRSCLSFRILGLEALGIGLFQVSHVTTTCRGSSLELCDLFGRRRLSGVLRSLEESCNLEHFASALTVRGSHNGCVYILEP